MRDAEHVDLTTTAVNNNEDEESIGSSSWLLGLQRARLIAKQFEAQAGRGGKAAVEEASEMVGSVTVISAACSAFDHLSRKSIIYREMYTILSQ